MITYDYNYFFGPNGVFESLLEGTAGFLAVYLAFFLLVFLAFQIVCYVLYARGLRATAKRRGVHHSWLAWIPVGSAWLLGSISDQYRYVSRSQVKNRRSVLFVFELALFVVGTLLSLTQFAGGFYTALDKSGAAGAMVGIVTLLSVVNVVLSVIRSVYYYFALYDLYASSQPRQRVLFLLLSIFFPVVIPFFVFSVRKSDLGMPPRKREELPVEGEVAEADEAAPLAVEEATEEVSDPEEVTENDVASTAEDPKPTDE